MAKRIGSDYIFDLPTVGQPAISPDGSQVVYVRGDVSREEMKGSAHLELVSAEGGAPRMLTSGDGDGMPRWSPDGSRIAFLRRPTVEGEPTHAQVWVLPLDGGEAQQVTDIAGGATSIVWMPSGAQLVVTANVDPNASDEEGPHVQRVNRIYYWADGIGWRGDSHRQLFLAEADGSGTRQLTRGDHDASSAAPSPDGRRIAFFSTDRSRSRQTKLPGRFELCAISARGGSVDRLVRDVRGSGSIAWSPDGREIAYIASDEDAYAYVWSVARRGGEPRQLTNDSIDPLGAGFPLDDGPPLVWHRRRITFLAAERGSTGIYSVAASGGRLQRVRTESELAYEFSSTPDSARFALTSSTLRRPTEVAVHEAATGDSRRLTSVSRDYVRTHDLARTERLTVARGEFDIDCWLTFPPGFDRNRRYPLILMIHGGPNGFYGNGWIPSVQTLAAQGYLVLWTNPRGSASYGADFMARVFEDWGGEDYEDQMAAVERVLRRPYVDGRRLGVTGYSYGGFMTSWIIGHTNRFKSAIVGAPVTNLYSMYGTTDIGVGFGERQWGGPPWTNLEEYAKHSPITYASEVETPVLLVHGELDIRCPIAQSEEYYVALKRMGKQVEFLRFPGGYHGFTVTAHPRLREAYVEEQLAWWKRTL